LTNGTVLVLDGATPPQESLLAENGRILAVGPRDEMRTLAGPDVAVVDLDGATAMPGIIDTHPHVLHFAAMQAGHVDLTDAVDHDDIVQRIRARAERTPKGQWIVTTPVGEPHYFIRRSYRDLAERRLPDRHVLDRATTDHPVWLQAWAPRQPAQTAFNSIGLQRIHLSDHIPDRVADVTIDKDWQGRLTGVLRGPVTNYQTYDPYWGQIVTKIAMQLGSADTNFGTLPPEVLLDAQREMNARGVTAVYECHLMSETDIASWQAQRDAGTLQLRVMTCLEPEAGADFYPLEMVPHDLFMERMERGVALRSIDDELLRIDGLSIGQGGPCFAGHFWSYDPYPDPYGVPTYGTRFGSASNNASFVEFCARNGVRMNVITGAYREHDEFLDHAEHAIAEHGRTNEWIVQHLITTSPAQVERFASLGVKMTTSVGFAWGKGDVYGERLGRHVWRDLVPLRRFLDAGLVVSAGSDWGPPSPFEQMQLAETHEFCGSGYRNDGPAQRVTRAEALAMWTRDAARVMNWNDIGTLTPGNHADITIVDRDPLTCPLDDLSKTQVLCTLLGGEAVFDAGALASRDDSLLARGDSRA
jgi:predicted amidohydrolase YtcJ